MLRSIIILFGITMIPLFELRASIPLGILGGTIHLPLGYSMQGMGMNWALVFFICVVANAILGALLYPVIDIWILSLERIPFFGKVWKKFVLNTQKKIHPYVAKWGTLGVAIFVGVPLPGSGSYSGALGAYLLGMNYRSFLVANTIGVAIAGAIVTAVIMTGKGLFGLIF